MEGEDSFVLFFLKGSEKWLANFSIVFFGKKSLILFFDELIYSLLLTSIVKKKRNSNEEVTFRIGKGRKIFSLVRT